MPTEIGDELRRTQRKTEVEIYEVEDGDTATLYELGIPVVELMQGDKFHVNVMQKIPLTIDRDNVPPAYLRLIRCHVLNETADLLNGEECAAAWVQDAAAHKAAKIETTSLILQH